LKRKISADRFGTRWTYISIGLLLVLLISLQVFTDWHPLILLSVAIIVPIIMYFTACYIGRVDPTHHVDEHDFMTRITKLEYKARYLAGRSCCGEIDSEKYRKKAASLAHKLSSAFLRELTNNPEGYLWSVRLKNDYLLHPYKDELKKRDIEDNKWRRKIAVAKKTK